MRDVVLRCGQCGLPWAKISNGVLVVESRHHGDRHVNVISQEELARIWREAQQLDDTDEVATGLTIK